MMSTRIARELAWGNAVFCVFLTDGSGHGVAAEERDAESRRMLTELGVPAENAAVITLAYRGISFWLPFVLGFAALRWFNRHPEPKSQET